MHKVELTKYAYSQRVPHPPADSYLLVTEANTFSYPTWQTVWAAAMDIINTDMMSDTYTHFQVFGVFK